MHLARPSSIIIDNFVSRGIRRGPKSLTRVKTISLPWEIQPEYGDEQADAGRNCRTRLWRNQILRRERVLQLTTSRIGNLLTRWLKLTLAICVTIQALLHTVPGTVHEQH